MGSAGVGKPSLHWYERAWGTDRFVLAAAGVTVVAALWFGFGPDTGQLLGIRIFTPVLAALTAVGLWRVGADRRLPARAARLWLVLSLALFIFTAGMVVDVLAMAVSAAVTMNPGETLIYPVGGLFAVVALVVFPTALRSRRDRFRTGLDLAIVLFVCTVFVWYYLQRFAPAPGWQKVADAFVLPGLMVVAGVALARLAFAGLTLVGRSTMACFCFAAAAAGASILLDVSAESALGRFGSMLQVLALAACVVGVSWQRRSLDTRPDPVAATSAEPLRRLAGSPTELPPLHGEQWAVFTVERAGRP